MGYKVFQEKKGYLLLLGIFNGDYFYFQLVYGVEMLFSCWYDKQDRLE